MDAILAGLNQLGQLNVLIALFAGAVSGVIIGAIPGLSPAVAIAVLLPATYTNGAADRTHPAPRHLFRRLVRRRDPGDPDQHAGYAGQCADDLRRLSDDAGRPGAAGAVPRLQRQLRRRHRQRDRVDPVGPAAGRHRLELRLGGIRHGCTDGDGAGCRRPSRPGRDGRRHAGFRAVPRHGRAGNGVQHPALHLRSGLAPGRRSADPAGPGPVRHVPGLRAAAGRGPGR